MSLILNLFLTNKPRSNDLLKLLKRIKYSSFHSAPDTLEDRGPLDGIRVCDMTRVLAGPYCTMILGDMGAEVIKIERPGEGDDTRHWGPPFVGGESCYYLSINRNKRSLCVDMKKKEGKDIIYELIKKSDVLVENFIPGKLDKLGFSYQDVKLINPRLVYCSITGFGGRSAEHFRPGYDLVASAIGGLMSITGYEDGEPAVVGVSITDIMTGMYANGAIMSALYERTQSNRGKQIDASLLQTQSAFLSHIASNLLNAGRIGKRHGTAHGAIVPYQAFKTSDGYMIVIAAANDKHYQAMCKTLGMPHLIEDERFITNSQRVQNRVELIEYIQERLLTEPSALWIELLEKAGVPCGRVNNIGEVFDMPQVKDLDLVQEISHPTAGTIRIPGPALDYDHRSILATPLHPPLLGEHTRDILKNLIGYNDTQIDTLVSHEVVEEVKT